MNIQTLNYRNNIVAPIILVKTNIMFDYGHKHQNSMEKKSSMNTFVEVHSQWMLSYTKEVILCYSTNLTGCRWQKFQCVIMMKIFRDDRNILSYISWMNARSLNVLVKFLRSISGIIYLELNIWNQYYFM